MELQIH